MRKNLLVVLIVFTSWAAQAQTTYYSKAIATDFTDVASWGTNMDGTGASPGSISSADIYIIQNLAVMNLNAANATVRRLTINTGSLTVSSNTLTVEIPTQNNTELNVVTGTLTLSGGTINVNGAVYFANGSGFTHSSGTMVVDGNSGTAATSIAGASGTQVIFGIGFGAGSLSSQISTAANASRFVLTGGTIRFVDPSGSSSTLSFVMAANLISGVHINAAPVHVFEFGDGISTTPGGSSIGFGTYPFFGNGRIYPGTYNVNSVATGNRFVSNNLSYGLSGDLNIIAGGEMQVNSALHIAGNILNNGTLTSISAAINFQGFANATTSVVATPQSVSGSGSFKNGVISTANFGSVAIWNSSATGVTFTNANTLLSGTNTGTVSGTLTFTTGIINTGANAFILGISTATVGTLSHIAGGFTPASTFSRWYDVATAGATITAGNEPALGGSGSYPFVIGTSKYQFALARPTVTGATGGIISVKYNHAAGLNVLGSPVADGAYSITNQTNASWDVTASAGFAAGTGTFTYAISGQNLYFASNGNSRVMKVATVVGTHQNGTVLPHGQRTAIAAADYLGTFYLGINSADMPVISAMSGAWEDPATWAGGVVPICGINVGILNTHTVTVNAAAANASSITVNAGGTLSVTGNTLTVGCINKNNSLTNSGTLSVSAGTLVVNGNVSNGTNANFSQTGGQITVDGNNGGMLATSVPTGTAIFTLGSGTHTLSGGTLTIVDPHAGAGATDDAFKYNHSSVNTVATTGHTLQLGDGVSTDAGGNATIGFSVEPRISSASFRLILGNVIVNTVSTGIVGNRFVAHRFSDVTITGNLTITSGRYASPAAILISVAGNIVNNGEMISTGNFRFASGSGSGTIVASTNAQTVSGAGVYANNATIALATGNFTSLLFNNSNATGITFNALNVITGNPANTINASTNLTFTLGRINVVSGTSFLMGTVVAGAGSTLAYTAGGFTAGSTYGRFWTASQTGTTLMAGAEPTSASAGRFPFIDATGAVRSVWIQRVSPTAAGITALTYTDAATVTTGLSIADGAYTVTNRYDGNWSVSTLGTTPSATSFIVAISAPGAYVPTNGNSRIIYGAAVIGASTHQNGTATPTAQRITITLPQLTAAPLYMGIAVADLALTSKQSGNWNDVNTWSTGVLPTCTDAVFIVNTHNVTVNSAANVSKAITINIGGSLTVASGDVTVGCTLNNSPLTNNGTLTVNGGALNINGNLLNANGSFFNQAGGTIKVDGNAANVIANSIASGINLVSFGTSGTGTTLNLTGGTLTIVDPHTAIAAAGGTSNGHAFAYWGNGYRSGVSHNMRLGDGVSTEVGGNTSGFQYNAWPGVGYFIAGNLVIDAVDPLQANKRFVTNPYSIGVEGNVAVISGSFQPVSILKVNGNINVNSGATLVAAGTIEMAKWGSDLTNNASSVAATAAQFIGGAGTYANLLVTPTANLNSFSVNNTSTSGVTLNVPLSISGTLTLNAGVVNTTAVNMLTLGISPAATGTLTRTSGFVKGPFTRYYAAVTTAFSANASLLPVGGISAQTGLNVYYPAEIAFTIAPGVGGTLTAEYIAGTAGASGLPQADGAYSATDIYTEGYWKIDNTGITGGIYGVRLTGSDFASLQLFTATGDARVIKRATGAGVWGAFEGTHTNGSSYTVQRDGLTTFSEFAITKNSFILPITLQYFKGVKTTGGNAIEWKVNCTSARISMEIERSADARKFNKITSISADQVRCNLPFYFTDAQPLKATNYYRLKMIDMDGTVSYSAVIAIINGDKGIEIVGMYPTVVNSTAFLSIAAAKAGKIQTTITDMSGKLIKTTYQSVAEGSSLISVDCSALGAGVYHITGYVDGARTKTIRFIKL